MNKKVVNTLIWLVIIYLIAWYILKIFFPEKFLLQINNEKLIKIGSFVDARWYLRVLFGGIFSCITYWLYLCAVCKQRKLSLKQNIIVIIVAYSAFAVEILFPDLITYYSILAMIILPAVFKAEMKRTAIVFSFHLICQWLSLSIRSLISKVYVFTFLTSIVMTLECYFWLLLFYLLFNYYSKEKGE